MATDRRYYSDTELESILQIRMDRDSNDAEAESIGDYLGRLLLTLWEEQDGFSGKRPFGNSGWDYDLYIPLIENNLIIGVLADDGRYPEKFDEEAGNEIIIQCIKYLFRRFKIVNDSLA